MSEDSRAAAESAKREGRELGARLREEASGAAEDVKAEGRDAARMLKDKASEYAETQKRRGVEQVDTTAEAVHGAADELAKASPQVANYVHEAAGALDRLGQTLRDKSPREMLADIEDLARRQPVAFFGAAVLAGFAVTRFAKSSASGTYHRSGGYEAGGYGSGGYGSGQYGGRSTYGASSYGERGGGAADKDRMPDAVGDPTPTYGAARTAPGTQTGSGSVTGSGGITGASSGTTGSRTETGGL